MKVQAHTICLTLLVTSLAACSGGNQEPPKATDTPAAPVTAQAPVPASPPVFDGTIASLQIAGQCSADVLNGIVIEGPLTGKAGESLTFGGWLADPQGKVPAKAQFVLNSATATYAFPVALGGIRQDVADTMKNPDLRESGYEAIVDVAGGAPGEYDLAIVMGEAPGLLCPLNRKFTIAG